MWSLVFLVGAAQSVVAQPGGMFRQEAALSEDDLFLLAPRELHRLLDEGKDSIDEKRYSEGITALSALLIEAEGAEDDVLGQDYFIAKTKPGYYVQSIKGEAMRLLSALPEEGRKSLEIQFGVKARKELDAAVAARSFASVAVVARRYPHTDAGYDALILLAQYKLASGYPLAAASLLQSMLDFPAARSRYGVQLATATAVAMRQAGRKDVAVATMKRAERDFAGSEIKVAGRAISMGTGADWSKLVDDLSNQMPLTDTVQVTAWMTSGGTPERNAVSSVGMPLPTPRWSERIHLSSKEEEVLNSVANEARKGQKVLLPKFELRIINDLVLMKATDNAIFGRDFATGLIKWRFYFHAAPLDLNNGNLNAGSEGSDAVSMELKNRVWGSSAFGNFSCDSERFYFVSTSDEQPINSNIFNSNRNNISTSNYLYGVGLAKQGAILWRIGGDKGEAEPKLAGAYFLGPPLAFEDQLYTLLEINGETRLVVLEAATGKLLWQQQLLQTQNAASTQDSVRRAMALTPTISDGVILCPTGYGAIVAVDMQSRNLRWGKTYSSTRQPIRNTFGGSFQADDAYNPLDNRWHEPTIIAHQGSAIVTPPDSNLLLCLDVLTGESKWKKEGEQRFDGRYVVGVSDKLIVTAGNSKVYAYRIADQRIAWELPFPKGQTLAGRGLWLGSSFMIPLSNKQIVKVDSTTGKVLESVTVDTPVGNLFAYKDQLLSATATAVSVFSTRESLSRELEERLSKDANDPWVLNQQSQLKLAEGKVAEAIDMLERSFKINPEMAQTRFFLVSTLLNAIETDFDKYQKIAQKYDQVFELSEQRFRYLQSVALGSVRSKQHYAAFLRLLELMKVRLSENFQNQQRRRDLLTIAPGYEVDSDAWIATQLANTYASAAKEDQAKMKVEILSQLEAVQGAMLTTKRQLMRYFAWLPDAAPTVYMVAKEVLSEDLTTAERMIQPALLSEDKVMQGKAADLLFSNPIEDWMQLGPFGTYSRNGRNYDVRVPILNGFGPGENVVNDPELELSLTQRQTTKPEWPAGLVENRVGAPGDRVNELDTMRASGNPELEGHQVRYGRPRLSIHKHNAAVSIVNELGQLVKILNVERGTSDNNSYGRCQVAGGLILIETVSELLALDMYRDSRDMDSLLWRHSLLTPAASPFVETAQGKADFQVEPLGFSTLKRDNSRASVVGPLTPTGVVVQSATVVSMLDSLSGAVVWSRDGFSDRTRFASNGIELAVVDPSTGVTLILDCRDGHELRRVDFKGDWRHWFSRGSLIVDFKQGVAKQKVGSGILTDSDNPSIIRVWNPFTGEVVQEIEFLPRSRIALTDDRYIVALEPTAAKTGKLHYLDLQTSKYVTHEVARSGNLDSLDALRFDDRLIVFSFDQTTWKESTNTSSIQAQVLADNVLAAGMVYGLNVADGSQLWNQPAKLSGYFVPRTQPRATPFFVAYRSPLKQSAGATLGLAMVDLRDASLAYANDLISTSLVGQAASLGQIAIAANPISHEISVRFGATDFVFTATDSERPPEPVFSFGHNGNKTATDNSKTPFNLFGK